MSSLEKTIREQQSETLIETTNSFKQIEELVRLGLMPVKDLPYIKRALVQMESGSFMPTPERRAFYTFINKLMEVSMGDPTILRQIKNKTAQMRNESHELDAFVDKVEPNTMPPVFPDMAEPSATYEGQCKCGKFKEAVKGLAGKHCAHCDKAHLATAVRDYTADDNASQIEEAIDLKKTPQGMLQTLANIIKNKKRAGGKPTLEDKKTATRAKNELRRRRHMGEEVEQITEAPHPVTKKEWASKHKDHKHQIGRHKYLMVLDKKTGGTVLKPVQVTESYKEAVEFALIEYGVSSISELGDLTKEFFAVVEAAIEPRAATKPHSDEVKSRVQDDIAKHKAKKEAALAAAKQELEAASKTELKKSYRNNAFKKEKD